MTIRTAFAMTSLFALVANFLFRTSCHLLWNLSQVSCTRNLSLAMMLVASSLSLARELAASPLSLRRNVVTDAICLQAALVFGLLRYARNDKKQDGRVVLKDSSP